MVGSGATVLMRKFGSAVGVSVCAGGENVNVGDVESSTSWERGDAVAVHETG